MHKRPVFFIILQDMAQQPVPYKLQRAYRDVAIPFGIFVLQIRDLRDEECMLLFLMLKPREPYDLKPVFFFGKMMAAVLLQLFQHGTDDLYTLVSPCRLPQPVKDFKKTLVLIVQFLDADRKIIFPFEQTRCNRILLLVPPGGLSDRVKSLPISLFGKN